MRVAHDPNFRVRGVSKQTPHLHTPFAGDAGKEGHMHTPDQLHPAARTLRAGESEARPAADLAQLSALADALVDEISATRRHFADLQEAVRQLEGETGSAEARAEPEVEPGPPSTEAADRFTGAPEGAKLAALNMALSGATKEEAREYLGAAFQLEGIDELLEDAFGVAYSDAPSARRGLFRRRVRGA
jgi:hypothetical protein